MKTRREAPKAARTRGGDRRRGGAGVRNGDARSREDGRPSARRSAEAPPRDTRPKNQRASGLAREERGLRRGPAASPTPRPARPKSASQAMARAKARKAKAPEIVRVPLRERVVARLTRLAELELNPRTLIARIPFVVTVIAALGVGLALTLWLSTDAAERSYRLGHARQTNEGLQQEKEALERQVLSARAAPALSEAARNLGMIPSRDTAHLVQDPGGSWFVVGTPKRAAGVSPPPLNVKLPDEAPPAGGLPPAPPVAGPVEPPAPPPTGGLLPEPPAAGLLPVPPSAATPEVPVGAVDPAVVLPLDRAAPDPAHAPPVAPAVGPLTGSAPPTPGLGLVLVPVPAAPGVLPPLAAPAVPPAAVPAPAGEPALYPVPAPGAPA